MTKRNRVITAIIIMLIAAAGIAIYFINIYIQNSEIQELDEFDLLELYAQNNDLVGWIQIENTGINYPVMNNDKYLRKNFNNEPYKAGTPFVSEGYNPFNKNILIYGHNMNYDKNMFYDLTKYKDKEFWEEHKKVIYYAICDDENNRKYVEKRTYNVYSTVITDIKEWNYWKYANENADLNEYIEEVKRRELYDTGVSPGNNNLTLSTCYTNITGDTGRIIVVSSQDELKRIN